MFRLNPELDVEALARRFALSRRIVVPDFLEAESALALHRDLARREDWRQILNSGDKPFELDRPTRAAMSPEQGAALDAAVYRGAREGFQYRHEIIRNPETPGDPLAEFVAWLSSGETRYVLRQIAGDDGISHAEAQATAYSVGDFRTEEDGAGRRRRIGFDLGLTRGWRPEWGGVLLFHDGGGRTLQGFPPAFNLLTLFALPQPYSLSMVTPSAGGRRYAISGWLLAG